MTRNNYNITKTIGLFFQLTKITITLPVTFLAFIGYSLAKQTFEIEVLWVCIGVFLLAGAASVLNQIIEKDYDAIMERTRRRLLPSGKIRPLVAWMIVLVMTVLGSVVLAQFNNGAVLLGFITLAWYIGVYTFLKRVTAFAVIPGSLTGALPPLIGWVAAGGLIYDPIIIYICFFVFLWQIPHFWLLILKYGEEYQQAGFPSLFDYFNEKQIQVWTFIWIIFSSVYSIILPILKQDTPQLLIILFLVIVLIGYAYKNLIRTPNLKGIRKLFHLINSFMVLILLVILIFGL